MKTINSFFKFGFVLTISSFSAVGCLLVNSCNNSNLTESHDKDAVVELTPAFIDSVNKYDRLGIYSEGYAAVCKEYQR